MLYITSVCKAVYKNCCNSSAPCAHKSEKEFCAAYSADYCLQNSKICRAHCSISMSAHLCFTEWMHVSSCAQRHQWLHGCQLIMGRPHLLLESLL